MQICDDGHEEIVFNARRRICPLCDARREIDEHEREGEEQRAEIERLKDEIEALTGAEE
jgi:hypothetical protein